MGIPSIRCGAFALTASIVGLHASDATADQALDALVTRYHAAGQFNGTLLVAKDGKVLLDKGYGMASFEHRQPNTPSTKHWFASVSKLFTATAVLRQVDKGKFSLDSKVSDLLPEYRKDTGSRITVRMLLNHTSGIPDYLHLPGVGREGFVREVGEGPMNLRTFLSRWCSGNLSFEPGSRWSYSNSGYVLLGAILESVTGKPLDQVIQTEVLGPAGMKDTQDMARSPRAVVEDLTPGYESTGTRLLTRRPWNMSTTYAAGSLVGPVRDLYRFIQAIETPGFLSSRAKAAMFTEGLGHWGCGWDVRRLPIGPDKAPRTVTGHEGYLFWTLARVYFVPEERLFVAMVNNTGDAPLPGIFEGITDVLNGRTPALPRPAASRSLREALERGGEPAMEIRFRELKGADVWDASERVLNAFGYELLQEGRQRAAVMVFRATAEWYPTSANAWDSLAEGLAIIGSRDEAKTACRRAIALDPTNRTAPELLKRLEAE